MGEIGVSVICLAYNHEKYIRRCLSSIVCQKTNFSFQVFVHDDASTDGSRRIIEEFEQKYPKIIRPIYQQENQHSKHIGTIKTFIRPLVDSRYVAYCEGDDYWIDETKLQQQYDAMEAHPECGVCLHRTLEVTENEKPTGFEYPKQKYNTGLITANELFATFVPRMYQTSSYFFRALWWHEYMQSPPAYKKCCDIGDVPFMLYFGSEHKVYHIEKAMSCYRRGALSSWSNAHIADESRMIRHNDSMVRTYKLFDEMTGGTYHGFVLERVSKHLYAKCAASGSFREYMSRENAEFRRELPFAKRMTVYLGMAMPKAVKRLYFNHTIKLQEAELKKWYGVSR